MNNLHTSERLSRIGFFVFGMAASTFGANGTWSSTASGANGFWTNSLNWSASPYPVGADTALFATSGNGQTNIDIVGLSYIKYLTFDTSLVGPYTLGTGPANSETLVLADSGEIKLSAAAGNSQIFNGGVQMGTDRTAQSYSLRNDSLSQWLTFNDVFACGPEISGNAGTKTLVINGVGPVAILGSIRQNGASTFTLTHNNGSTLALSGSNVINVLNLYGGPNSVLDIGSKELVLNGNGGNVLNCTLGGTITGAGKLRLSTWDGYSSAGYNYADLNVLGGKTLVINCEITGQGGLESNSGTGTFVLNGTNTFLGHMNLATVGGTISVSTIGNRGVAGNCGMGTNLYFANTSRLLYTGTGEDTDRVIVLNNTGTIEQSGPGGKLTFTAMPILTGGSRQLTLQGSTAGVGEFSAPLANTGSYVLNVVKTGEGTWIFSRTNTYTGATAVNGGKLLINRPGSLASGGAVTVNSGAILGGNGVVNGSSTVAAGGALAPGDVNTAGTLIISNALSLTSGTLLFDVSNVATDLVVVTGALTVNGTNTVVLNLPAGGLSSGTYTLMTNTSTRAGTGSFALSPAYVNATLVTNAASLKLVVVNTGAYGLTWKGNVTTSWDGTDLNWTNGSAAVAFTPGDVALFDDTAANFSVDSTSPVLPSSVLFNNSVSNYAVSAAIGGTGAVYKLGSGTVSLTGGNTYAGQTAILGGTLRIDGTGQLGGGNYATNLINNGELVYAGSAAQTNSGIISGGGNLAQLGSGLLTLSGNNTYVGMTIVTSGVLRAQHANALGTTAMGTVVAPGGTLDLAGTNSMAAEFVDLSGTLSCSSGSNTINGIVNIQNGATLNAAAGAFIIINSTSPAIGSNTFTKTGPGLLRFTADPNPNGMFIVDEGTVELQHSGSTDMSFTINPNGTLREITAGDFGDNYTIQADGTLDMRASDAIGGFWGSGLVTNSGSSAVTLTVDAYANSSGAFSGVIRNGAGAATLALAKSSASSGFLTLSGANTFSGGLTLSGGQLNINNGGTTSAESAIGTGTFTMGGGLIDNTSGADVTLLPVIAQNWNSDFTFIGSKSLNLGAGNATLSANRTVTVSNNTLTVGGAISGAYTLTKNGAGSLVLNGANTYSGATTVNGGSFIVNGSTAAGSAITVNSGLLGGTGTINGTASLVVGSMLSPGGLGSVGTLTFSNSGNALSLNGNTLLFDLSSTVDSCDKAKLTAGTGKMVLTGTNFVALTFPSAGTPAGSYTLMTCPGGVTTNSGAVLKLLTPYPNATLSMVATNLVLTLSATASPGVAWGGGASGKWDGGDLNWTADGSTSIAYPAGASVTFSDGAGNFGVFSDAAVSPATVTFANSLSDYTVSAQISGTAPFGKVGTAAVTLTGTSGYNPASIFVSDGPLLFSGTSQLYNGNYAGGIVDNSSLIFSNSNPQVLSGILSGGGALTKFGNATLTLAGSNFFSGVTTVNAGILKVTHPYGLGSTINGTVVNPGATLELAGNISTLGEAVTLNGVLSSQSGNNTLGGTLTLTTGSSIDVGAGSVLSLKGFQANGPFTKTGAGWLKLTVDPNGNGLMTVQNGTVEITAGTMDSCVVVNNGATLVATALDAFNNTSTRIQMDTGSTYILRQWDQIGGLAGAGTITQDTAAQAWLNIGNNGFSETFSGTMQNGSGVLGLTKVGIGVQTLTGVNTYTGPTTVGVGTLLVNSPGSLAGTTVTVSNSATLGGSGTIGGPVAVLAGGNLAPGGINGIGTFTLGSTVALNGSTLFFDLTGSGTTGDAIAMAGALSLNGTNFVSLAFPDGSAPAGDYTLMTFPSYAGTGSFALIAPYPNTTLTLNGTSLVLHVGSGTTLHGLTWSGAVSSVWDGGAMNWNAGGSASGFTSGDSVLFDDSAASQYTVNSLGPVAPSAIVFNNSIYPYYVAAPVTGVVALVKNGTAVACINGTTAINPPAIAVNAGTFILANSAQLNNGTYAGNVVINGNFNHYSSASQTMSGFISGIGSITKSGGGTMTLIGTNAFLGGMTLSGGTLIGRGAPTVFGLGGFTSGGGTVELQNDADMAFTNNVIVSGATTFKAGRVSAGTSVNHAFGTMTISASADFTITVSAGSSLNSNVPYGLTFGTFNLNGRNITFTVNNNGSGLGTLTLGSVTGNYNLTKNGSGLLFLPVAGNSGRSSVSTTLNGGILKLGNPGSLGTSGNTLTLTSGILDLAIDSSVFAHNTTVNGNVTSQCDRATANAAGITHTLGTLSIGAYSFCVTNGPNVLANSPYGLTFGATALTGNPTFDVADSGTLTLGAISGNYTLTKRNHGTLKLTGVNSSTAATTVNQGKLMGVTGGSSASSAVTLQSAFSANAVAKLGVLCATPNGTWTCSSLTLNAVAAPAVTNPALEFAFSVPPSGTVAPLQVTGAATFTASPSGVAVYLGSLSVTNGVYPLMTVGSAATKPVPTLTVYGGYAGSTLAWVGNTLYLTLNGSPSPIVWSTGATGSGVWDVNNAGNQVWKDNTGTATSYQEPVGATGNSVLFGDSNITANTTVTLNSIVSPTAAAFSNDTYSYTFVGVGGIAGNIGLTKNGTNVVTFGTPNSYTGGTAVANGTLRLSSGGAINHPNADVVVGNTLFTNALLRIDSGAVGSNRWLMVGTTNGACGAVYNQGTLGIAGSTTISNFALGFAPGSYGYYRHDTLIPTTIPETGIGGAFNGDGVMDVMRGAVTNATYFQLNRAYSGYQSAGLNVLGGSMVMPNSSANAHFFYSGTTYGTGIINVANGGLLGSAGTGTELDLIKSSTIASTLSVLNILPGGTVQATKVKASQSAGIALVNFNGGALKANYSSLVLGGSNIDRATVYANGATVDTDGKFITLSQALLAPVGNGVLSIPVTANGVGYIGRPIVAITGGGGTGATAIAEFDPDSQQVTGVTVTSPGFGYTSAPTVAFVGGGGTAPTVGTATYGVVPSGGLTVIGGGMLTLSGVNTYSGMTTISNATLRLGVANALPTNAPITIVAGGVLDLNGFTVTNGSINLISGSVINGKIFAPSFQGADAGAIQAQIVSTNGLVKEGSDTLIVSAPLAYSGNTVISGGTLKLSGRQPGLYEGRVANAFELSTANPKTATPLSTRYANMWFVDSASAGGIWPDNTTYVYSGYLWNDAATNETWSFYRCFDDSTRLMINGTNVLLNTNMSGTTVISNAVMRSGWNAFELRLGEGSGSVGNNGSFPNMGVGYDRMGRGQAVYANFKTLTDPGDGSLLTLTNIFDLANANLLPTNSAVTLAAGATLDLGGTGQKIGGLSGSGTVTNGTLSVNGVIAPGGIGTIGTLTLSLSAVTATNTATLSGTLRVDVSDDGTCDVLAVNGNVNLSNLSLVVENGSAFNGKKTYTLLTYSGTRTGTFASKSTPSGWGLVYGPGSNGDVKLKYFGATVIQLR